MQLRKIHGATTPVASTIEDGVVRRITIDGERLYFEA